MRLVQMDAYLRTRYPHV